MMISLSWARLWLVAVLATARLAFAAPADPLPGADEKWRHFQSPHFEVYSRNSESESRDLLHNLELVHAIFFETFGFTASRAVPVTVYFFSREKHFEAYKPAAFRQVENVSAFYHGGVDRGVMTIAPLPTYEAAQRLAFGSYTYHLFRLMNEHPPTWYRYGMSGLFSNLNLTSEQFELGRAQPPQVARLQTINLLPVEVMLGADQKSNAYLANQDNHLFHDESWALLHYLYFGQHQLPRARVEEFVRYALATSRQFDAAATRERFEATLGLTYQKLNRELDRYFRSGRYSYSKLPLPAIPPAKSYAMRKVPLAEIRLRLAELGLRVNRSPEGKLALLQVKADSTDAARALEVLGADAIQDSDWQVAEEKWNRAYDAGSANPAILHELGQFADRQRFRRFDLNFRLPDEQAGRLRDLLEKSLAVAPEQASAYEVLAWVEATAGTPSIANVNRIQASFKHLADKPRVLLALAIVRLRLDDKAGATEILEQLGRMEASDWVRSGLEYTRAKLEDRPVNRANLPAAKPVSSDPVLRMGVGKPRP